MMVLKSSRVKLIPRFAGWLWSRGLVKASWLVADLYFNTRLYRIGIL